MIYELKLNPTDIHPGRALLYQGIAGIALFNTDVMLLTKEQFKLIPTNNHKGFITITITPDSSYWKPYQVTYRLLIWKELRKSVWYVYWRGDRFNSKLTHPHLGTIYKRKLEISE